MASYEFPLSTVTPVADSALGASGAFPAAVAQGHEHPKSSIYVDAAKVASPPGTIAVNKLLEFTVAGEYPAGDGSLLTDTGRLIQIASVVPTVSAASVTFTGLDDTYRTFLVLIEKIRPLTDSVDLWARIGIPAIQSGATDYSWRANTDTTGAPVFDTTSDHLLLNHTSSSNGNAVDESVSSVIWIARPLNAEPHFFHVFGKTIGDLPAAAGPSHSDFSGRYQTAGANIDRIQFLWSSGNFSADGRIRLFGVK